MSVRDDEGDLVDIGDLVSTCHDKGRDGRRGERRGGRVAALTLAHLVVPAAPHAGGREHASSTAHVLEGTLSGAVGSSAGDTGCGPPARPVPQDSAE